ncbi:hypothetical protein [Streptomyces sp. G45]|uniref:hypothetical protein n=1 Tax=Streptomyces sp. G45 TaxID=3406627 RepID=UPI003C19B6D5
MTAGHAGANRERRYACGDVVFDSSVNAAGTVVKAYARALRLRAANGYEWGALARHCLLLDKEAPPNTRPLPGTTPSGVERGDYVSVEGRLLRVVNMWSPRSGTGKVLVLRGRRQPWRLDGPVTVYRQTGREAS